LTAQRATGGFSQEGNGKGIQKATIEAQDDIDLVVPLKLAGLAGTPVRLEFTIVNGQLYSFWIV
jgi:hypothetical protein